jgi:hypothetical protein
MNDSAIEVTPETWVLPNRKGYQDWIHKTFHSDRYPPNNRSSSLTVRLFPHQRLIRDYMQFDSPYRGLILYHGLGVGKTCASIAAAEGFLANHRKVIVMVPASLAMNYRQEIMRCATIGSPTAKLWNLIDVKENPKAVPLPPAYLTKHDHKVWSSYIPQDAKVLRENVAWSKLSESERQYIMDTVATMIDHKYTFINFNGLTTKMIQGMDEDFFKGALVIMDEAHNFMSRVMNGSRIASSLYNHMMHAKGIRFVLLSGTPVINHPFELSYLLNLVRGPMHVHEGKLSKNVATNFDLGDLAKYVDHFQVSTTDPITVEWTLAPEGYVLDTDRISLKKEAWGRTPEKVIEDIQKALKSQTKASIKFTAQTTYALPFKKDQFAKWFLDETDPDHPKVKHMDLFIRRILGVVSYFRTAGEEFFPRITVKKQEQVPLSDYQFSVYSKVRKVESEMEKRKSRMARFGPRETGVFASKGTVYRAFSRMACNFVFPEETQRKYPMELRKELNNIMRREIDDELNEDDQRVDRDDAEANVGTTTNTDRTFIKNYEEDIRRVMSDVEKNASTILSKESLATTFSPKCAKILEHIENSRGKVLLYSQFRAVEGLGIMRLILNQAGFKEVSVDKKGGKWHISNPEVLSPNFVNKRYAMFDADRERTKVLLQLYNGEWEALPIELQEQLRVAKVGGNVWGEFLRVFMITQSGAEGISLKNVRKVLIMEPFWNMVRMDQVIGRAVRTGSHQDLPPEERTVEVYTFISTFTESQLKSNFTLKREDNGLTSDAYIMQIAESKDQIIQSFLDQTKMASVDCRSHAATNKLTTQGIKCYAFPIPVDVHDESYVPIMEKDALRKSSLVRKKKIQGKVVSMQGKKYVIVDEYPNKIFDYHAYKDAGVLSEALIL